MRKTVLALLVLCTAAGCYNDNRSPFAQGADPKSNLMPRDTGRNVNRGDKSPMSEFDASSGAAGGYAPAPGNRGETSTAMALTPGSVSAEGSPEAGAPLPAGSNSRTAD